MMEKTYKISVTRNNSDKENILEGTIDELLTHFVDALHKANSVNPKVKTGPFKDIKMLVNAAQKAYSILEKDSFGKTFFDIVK